MLPNVTFADLSEPGLTRRVWRGKLHYFDIDGGRVRDAAMIDRLAAIGLPPAYRQCWYAPDADAHILATGIDAAGRRQYRYHPDFTAYRDALKFGNCAAFGRALPLLRARVEHDLARRGLTLGRAIASIVTLLDSGQIRVGNARYARDNGSFGATTLRRRHAALERRQGGERLRLSFKAKSGKHCRIEASDRGLIRFVKAVQDLPGQQLFQYAADDGDYRPVTSGHVNDYIRDVMGEAFTAKDFRTWRASVLALEWLTSKPAEPGLKPLLAHVSAQLNNTPALARKAYIHPHLIEAARDHPASIAALKLPRKTRWLSRHERGLIALLEGAG